MKNLCGEPQLFASRLVCRSGKPATYLKSSLALNLCRLGVAWNSGNLATDMQKQRTRLGNLQAKLINNPALSRHSF